MVQMYLGTYVWVLDFFFFFLSYMKIKPDLPLVM